MKTDLPLAVSCRCLVSIHDVMPEVLDQVARLIELFTRHGTGPVTLLVVPGSFATVGSTRNLKNLIGPEVELAGHGWHHLATPDKDLYHRLHALLISRNVAEHLTKTEAEIISLISDCAAWFRQQELPTPNLYVPPAWAMGRINRKRLQELPFSLYEDQGGLFDSRTEIYRRLPLLGFEADSALRRLFLRLWNRLNLNRGNQKGLLRIAVHPEDLDLQLSGDLESIARKAGRRIGYEEVFGNV